VCLKTSKTRALVCRLAVRYETLGDSKGNRGNLFEWRLAVDSGIQRCEAPGDTCPLPGGLEACCAWCIKLSNCGCLLWCAWSTRILWYLKGWLAGVPWVVPQNVSLELWLGTGVKHVAFLELWLGMTSLELWLGMADEHEKILSCGLS